MKILPRGEPGAGPRFERLWVLLAVPAFLLAALVVAVLPVGWLPRCGFRALTGWPCATCGGTRAMRLLAEGDVGAAWRLQPLWVALLGIAALLTPYAAAVAAGWMSPIRLGLTRRERWIALGIAAALVMLNWLYLLMGLALT